MLEVAALPAMSLISPVLLAAVLPSRSFLVATEAMRRRAALFLTSAAVLTVRLCVQVDATSSGPRAEESMAMVNNDMLWRHFVELTTNFLAPFGPFLRGATPSQGHRPLRRLTPALCKQLVLLRPNLPKSCLAASRHSLRDSGAPDLLITRVESSS
jgi:hypothetical protein